MDLRIEPLDFPALALLRHAALTAVVHLGLQQRLERLDLVLDAPEFEASAFWSIELSGGGRVHAALYGSPRDVLRPGAWNEDPGVTLDLSRLGGLSEERVDRLRVDRWLHRNLLQLDDLLSGRVLPASVPPRRAAGMQAVWDVWTDGRLRARQFPGLTQAERRRIFFRVFAQHGLLLPRHWDVFHRLWNDEYADQGGLLAALDALPQAG
jgi:hypothetical protein